MIRYLICAKKNKEEKLVLLEQLKYLFLIIKRK